MLEGSVWLVLVVGNACVEEIDRKACEVEVTEDDVLTVEEGNEVSWVGVASEVF
jgi:hypothetical protein